MTGPVLIVVPSLLSGAGLALVLVAIFVGNDLLEKILLSVGVILLWVDFFTTMAIFRYTLRNMNRRLGRIERDAAQSARR